MGRALLVIPARTSYFCAVSGTCAWVGRVRPIQDAPHVTKLESERHIVFMFFRVLHSSTDVQELQELLQAAMQREAAAKQRIAKEAAQVWTAKLPSPGAPARR